MGFQSPSSVLKCSRPERVCVHQVADGRRAAHQPGGSVEQGNTNTCQEWSTAGSIASTAESNAVFIACCIPLYLQDLSSQLYCVVIWFIPKSSIFFSPYLQLLNFVKEFQWKSVLNADNTKNIYTKYPIL